ncbi:MAG: GIY-YIG nuclease family protein [Candidatus Hodarchaeales archaeon]|jgi:predicted GIY-YIG superfamily endonuclease
MPFWIYMLFVGDRSRGKNRKIYTGYTHYLMPRIAQHSGLTRTKGARLTRNQPVELVYLEAHSSRKKALQRERQLKHQSPHNQKKSKLKMIEEFHSSYGDIIQELNQKLHEYFEFLEILGKVMNLSQKELQSKIKINQSH